MGRSTATHDALAETFLAPSRRPSDRGPLLFGLLAAGVFFGGLGTWATLAPLSSAVVAPGQVKVESHRKTIQHLEGGIVDDILVREGELVQAGQMLLRLDDTQAGTTLELLRGQHDALKAVEARLVAERDALPAINFPSDVLARAAEPNVAAILAGQGTIFASRRRALDGQVDILKQRIEQQRYEIAGYQAQVSALGTQAGLIKDEIKDVKQLIERGLERKARLLALQRESANLEGHRGQQLNLIAKAYQSIGEAEMEIIDLANRHANQVVTELRDTQAKLADLEEKLRAALDVKARTVIVAPQAGKIVDLRQFTLRGVVKPGEPILDIVPRDDRLTIEAEIRPMDSEAIHVGLPAEVRLTAYKQRRTPTVDGEVIYVSADTLQNQRTGQTYYVVRVEVAPEQLSRLEGVRLYPGMPVEVMIRTGERTALEYLIDPVRDSFVRAFRER